MPSKYPDFKDELDLDALEIVVTHIVEVLDRHVLNVEAANHLKGLLVRASPYYRQKIGSFGPRIMSVAHWDNWNGTIK